MEGDGKRDAEKRIEEGGNMEKESEWNSWKNAERKEEM